MLLFRSTMPYAKALFGDSLTQHGISITRNIFATSPYPATYSRYEAPWLDNKSPTMVSYTSTCAEATAAAVAVVASSSSGISIGGHHQYQQHYPYHYGHQENEVYTPLSSASQRTLDMRQAQDMAKAAAAAAAATEAALRYPTYWHPAASTSACGTPEYHPTAYISPSSSPLGTAATTNALDQVTLLW